MSLFMFPALLASFDLQSALAAWVDRVTWVWAFRAALCFAMSALADACWAMYMRRATSGNASYAAWFAVLLLAIGMFNIQSWLLDKAFIPAILAGAWIGTYFTVRIDHERAVAAKAAEAARVALAASSVPSNPEGASS